MGKAFNIRVVYMGIFKIEGRPFPCLAYSKRSERPDGQIKTISSSVPLRDSADLMRLQKNYKHGDEIELTLTTDEQTLSTRLINFALAEKDKRSTR